MAFNALTVIQNAVAARLHKAYSPDLSATPFWPAVIADAQTRAYNEILSRLAVRGYTPAQIAAWDRGAEFESRLAVFFALSDGRGLDQAGNVSDTFLSALDVRDELSGNEQKNIAAVPVVTAGVCVTPAGAGAVGLVGTGPLSTAGDSFVFDNSTDSRTGEPTRW